jgi:hypothetical protein
MCKCAKAFIQFLIYPFCLLFPAFARTSFCLLCPVFCFFVNYLLYRMRWFFARKFPRKLPCGEILARVAYVGGYSAGFLGRISFVVLEIWGKMVSQTRRGLKHSGRTIKGLPPHLSFDRKTWGQCLRWLAKPAHLVMTGTQHGSNE